MDRPFTLAHLYSVNYFIIPPRALPEIKTQFLKMFLNQWNSYSMILQLY